MTHRERTVQQLDPLGVLGARLLTGSAAVAMVGYSIVMTWFNREDISSYPVAILALAAVVVSAGIIVYGSSPIRSPLRRNTFVLALGAAFLASILNSTSMWETNRFIQDDWGPVVLGLFFVGCSPYRLSREIALSGLLTAIFTGFVVLLEIENFATAGPAIVFVLVAITPILAMAFGSAAITGTVVRSLRRWRSRATIAAQAHVSRLRDGITRSVQQDRVTILNRDVVPFFSDVLHRGEVTDDDRSQARVISESIRSVMVADVDRSWLDGVVDQAGAATLGSQAPGAESVQDDERLAVSMTTDQRTATRALFVALFSHPEFDPDGFDIRITRGHAHLVATVRAGFTAAEAMVRADLAPYFAVLRVVFVDVEVEFAGNTLTLRFFYDEH